MANASHSSLPRAFSSHVELSRLTGITGPHSAPPQTVRSYFAAASMELAQIATAEQRIVVVSLTDSPAVLDPWQHLPGRMFQAQRDVHHAVTWCASLAGSAHPFVLVGASTLSENLKHFQHWLDGQHAPSTLLVHAPLAGNAMSPAPDPAADIELLQSLPGLAVLCPADDVQLRTMLLWCLKHEAASAIWLPDWPDVPRERVFDEPLELGKCSKTGETGDLAIFALGPTAAAALDAAKQLTGEGIRVTVLNGTFAEPLDARQILATAREHAYVIIAESQHDRYGFGRRVLELLAEHDGARPVSVVMADALGRNNPCDLHDRCVAEIVLRGQSLSRLRRKPASAARAEDHFGQGEPGGAILTSKECLEEARHEHQRVLDYPLSPTVAPWAAAYAEVGKRGVYLWRWCLYGLELIALPCIAPALCDHLRDTKLLAVMLGVMLDDIADQAVDEEFLKELIKVTFEGPTNLSKYSEEQQRYARFTIDLWNAIETRLKSYPHYHEYEALLAYDHQQIVNAMEYSCLLNSDLCMVNLAEHDAYLPHNMQMMSFATMDLMCSPAFDRRDLGKLREVIWHAQCMGRIGNLVSTWERELKDRDFTSGVFARALVQGDLTVDELRTADSQSLETVIREGGHQDYFLRRWQMHRTAIRAMQPQIRSVDVGYLVDGLDRLIRMELGSRGFK